MQRACKNFPTLLSALCFDSFWGEFPPGSWVQNRYGSVYCRACKFIHGGSLGSNEIVALIREAKWLCRRLEQISPGPNRKPISWITLKC